MSTRFSSEMTDVFLDFYNHGIHLNPAPFIQSASLHPVNSIQSVTDE